MKLNEFVKGLQARLILRMVKNIFPSMLEIDAIMIA